MSDSNMMDIWSILLVDFKITMYLLITAAVVQHKTKGVKMVLVVYSLHDQHYEDKTRTCLSSACIL